MKKVGIVVIIIVILIAAYFGRHKIKAMVMGAPTPPPAAQQAAPTQTTAAVPSDNIYKTATDAKLGSIMTDFNGMTLYTFDKDTSGVSNCTGQCLVAWPFYTSGATAQKTFPENITVIKRADGKEQFAWKGMPLYYYSKDTKAGETLGDGVGGIWHVVKM